MEYRINEVGEEGATLSGADLDIGDALTVEAWGYCEESRAEALQVLVAQWPLQPLMSGFDTYDAGETDGLDTRGFFGAVFDGRYVYFAPQHDSRERHGKVLRYDTHGAFTDPGNWAAHDASKTDGMDARGYYGAVFDGCYVYFVPRTDGMRFHTRILRYDTQGAFRDEASWSAYDVGHAISYQGGAFDGRFIYFAPGSEQEAGDSGKVLRYDTRGEFAAPDSYVLYDAGRTSGLDARCYDGAVFDGRHVYFAPLAEGGVALRCDVKGTFTAASTWEAFDARAEGLGTCVGAVFDGRYVYYVPYAHSRIVRFDTEGDFAEESRWQMRDAGRTSGLRTVGYDGGAFDGRYVYFIPFWEGDESSQGYHARLLRYDTQGDFADPASWQAADAAPNPGGFNGGAFDGRYLYCAPWRLGSGADGDILTHGQVLRYDTAAATAAFALKYMDCGHNGGLGAALPGPSFAVNTRTGVVSARANRNPGPGWHHLAGTYDGAEIRLYVDGVLAGRNQGKGPVNSSDADIAIGRFAEGGGKFSGVVEGARIADTVCSPVQMRTACQALRGL